MGELASSQLTRMGNLLAGAERLEHKNGLVPRWRRSLQLDQVEEKDHFLLIDFRCHLEDDGLREQCRVLQTRERG